MITILWWMFLSVLAQADCSNLKLRLIQNQHDFNSDAFPTIQVEVERNNQRGCSFFVTCDYGGATGFSSRRLTSATSTATLSYQICLDGACSNICKHIPEASSNSDVMIGSFPNNAREPTSVPVQFRPKLGAQDFERFGTYENTFSLRLYEGTLNGTRVLEDTKTFRVRYNMAKKISLALVNTGANFDPNAKGKTLDFGTLESGKQATFDLVLKYNAGYRVKLSSQNNGRMKLQTGNDLVPYTFYLQNNPIALQSSSSTPVTAAQGTGVSPSGGHRFPGRIAIGSFSAANAGTYLDTVTITVESTE